MWDPNTAGYIQNLQDLSLFEDNFTDSKASIINPEDDEIENRYVLTPFLQSYIEKSIDADLKRDYLNAICHYYLYCLGRGYMTLLRVGKASDDLKTSLTSGESHAKIQNFHKSANFGRSSFDRTQSDPVEAEYNPFVKEDHKKVN